MTIVICSKSRWDPPMRREHAFAREAARHGHSVDFVEAPQDVRDGLRARGTDPDGLRVWPRWTPVPGHRGWAPRAVDNRLLAATLRMVGTDDRAVVVNAPWQWAAVRSAPASRRVFDCADNWTAMLPARSSAIRRQCARIADEADEVIVANPELRQLFGGRGVVVRNGTDDTLVERPPAPPPRAGRIVYVGTLSERLDAALLGDALTRLPEGWSVTLYGPCRYAPGGSAEFGRLLDHDRVAWEGPVPRSRLAEVLDGADVLVLPNRPHVAAGQDSMKLYDYCARGRPIVSTRCTDTGDGPPHVQWADDADDFAAAVERAVDEPPALSAARRTWARSHTYGRRWPLWEAAVTGGAR